MRGGLSHEISNEFNFGMDMSKRFICRLKWLFRPRYVIDPQIMPRFGLRKMRKEACKYDAIDLEMKEKTIDLQGRIDRLGHRLDAL
jgi:quinone-modifying oxidoreductase, subunit QmoA